MRLKYILMVGLMMLSCGVNAQCWNQISAGVNHNVAIKADSTLWAWGSNDYGQLGDGTIVSKNTPVQIGNANKWINISTGYYHTLALKADGTLWAWGRNDYGQLGDGTILNKNTPVKIGTATNWKNLCGGYLYTMALKTDGTLWAWGANYSGQLGDGTIVDKKSPVQIGTATNWASISADLRHTLAIKTNGTLWAWGYNAEGELGDGTTVDKNSPLQIGTATNWSSASAGYNHTIALKTNGTLWAWGWNADGQLGDSTNIIRKSPVQIGISANWLSISADLYHTIALKSDSTLWAWGINDYSQLGDGTTVSKNSPIQIGNETDWSIISAGRYHTTALKTNGTLWTWGRNNYGQLGDGTTVDKIIPMQLACPGICTTTPSVTAISNCGSYTWNGNTYTSSSSYIVHLTNATGCDSSATLNLTIKQPTTSTTIVNIKSAQLPYNWNGVNYTQSGIYTKIGLTNVAGCDSTAILNLNVFSGCLFKQISAGAIHNIAIQTDGNLWAWGGNNAGQLGDGTIINKNSPLRIGLATNWKNVSAGELYTLAIKTNGTLWAWGRNDFGQLGDGTIAQQNNPVQIGAANNWKSVSAGDQYTLAIKTDGTLWAWGRNNWGQLGDGTNIDKKNPVQIGIATNWLSISAGGGHTVALKSDGTLWAWGYNIVGQLGDGTTINKNIPTQIGTATNWLSISIGSGGYTVALKSDSTLWTWGNNDYGQLGDGTTINKSIPIQIGTATNWASICAGNRHTLALKSDGTLWAWGKNDYGQLGDSTTVDKNSPMQIGTATNWSTICAGVYHTIASKTNGNLWAWGRNNEGELGDGTLASKIVPVQISSCNCTPTTSTIAASNCGSYVWNGVNYTTSGTYTKTGLTSITGCDSTATLNLTINPNLSGNIIHPTKGSINNVTLNYNGTKNNFINGKYNYDCITSGTNILVKPTKNNDINKTNGVNGADVIAVQRHFLNLTKITNAYKLIAADVTGDKVINGTDVLRMKRLILNLDTTFNSTIRGARLWEFVDSAYVFPDTLNPFPFKDSISFTNLTSNKTNQTFIGVKLGDVNYSWDNTVAKMSTVNGQQSMRNALELIASISNEQLPMGNEQLVTKFSTSNFKELAAMQYTLHFDNTKYEFVGIENNKLNIDFNSSKANETGNIAMLWADANGEEKTLEDGTALFNLILKPINRFNNGLSTIDYGLFLNNDITEIAAYDKDLQKHNITLTKRETINDKLDTRNEWFSIYPNPATGSVYIETRGCKQILIIDYLGRTVKKINNINHQISEIDIKQLNKGIYTVRAVMQDGMVQNSKLLVE